MVADGLLQDPTSAKVLLHLLYSGPRTNKEIVSDFSAMRIRTKTGVLLRGRSGYHYVRKVTNELDDAGLLRVVGSMKEKVYEFNLDSRSGLLARLSGIRDFQDWGYIEDDLGFTAEHLNRIVDHSVFRDAAGPGFDRSRNLEGYRCRMFMYRYRQRLRNGADDPFLAALVFVMETLSSVTEVDSSELWQDIHDSGVEEVRSSIKRDFNAYNWRNLPDTMTREVEKQELDSYIDEYRGAVDPRIMSSVVDLLKVKTSMTKDDVVELVSYAYLVQRLFLYALYCYLMNKDIKKVRSVQPVSRSVLVEGRDVVKGLTRETVRDGLKRLNREVGKTIGEGEENFVVLNESIYSGKEFVELVKIRYKEEAKAAEQEEKNYAEATGREFTGLDLSSALEIVNNKDGPARPIDTFELVKTCVSLYGKEFLKGMKTLVKALRRSGHSEYFDMVDEMYEMELPRDSD